MEIYLLLSTIGSIISAFIALITVIVDVGDKGGWFYGIRISVIKKYSAFGTFFFTVIALLLSMKKEVKQGLIDIKTEAEMMQNLYKIRVNTDPISKCHLTMTWKPENKSCFDEWAKFLDEEEHENRAEVIIDDDSKRISKRGRVIHNEISSIHLYFIDSVIYRENPELFFRIENNDCIPTDTMMKLIDLHMEIFDDETQKYIIERSILDEVEYQPKGDNIFGEYEYLLETSKPFNKKLDFSDLASKFCILSFDQSRRRIAMNAFKITNGNETKTIKFSCSLIESADKKVVFLSRGGELTEN